MNTFSLVCREKWIFFFFFKLTLNLTFFKHFDRHYIDVRECFRQKIINLIIYLGFVSSLRFETIVIKTRTLLPIPRLCYNSHCYWNPLNDVHDFNIAWTPRRWSFSKCFCHESTTVKTSRSSPIQKYIRTCFQRHLHGWASAGKQ